MCVFCVSRVPGEIREGARGTQSLYGRPTGLHQQHEGGSQGNAAWLGGGSQGSLSGAAHGPGGATATASPYANKAPRVGGQYQATQVPWAHFLDGNASTTADPTLVQGQMLGGHLQLELDALSAGAVHAAWPEADRAAFEAAFLAHPSDWARITAEVNAQAAASATARSLAGFATGGWAPALPARVRTVEEVRGDGWLTARCLGPIRVDL